MLDVIAAIFAAALYATVVGVLIGLSPMRAMTRLAAFAAAAAWLGIVVAVAAPGGLAPGVLGPVPTNLLPLAGLLALLFGGWFFVPQFRGALLSVRCRLWSECMPGALAVSSSYFFMLVGGCRRRSRPPPAWATW
jgi:hypothetical protein